MVNAHSNNPVLLHDCCHTTNPSANPLKYIPNATNSHSHHQPILNHCHLWPMCICYVTPCAASIRYSKIQSPSSPALLTLPSLTGSFHPGMDQALPRLPAPSPSVSSKNLKGCISFFCHFSGEMSPHRKAFPDHPI